MQTLQHSYSPALLRTERKQSILSRFFEWCNDQEEFRFGWVAAIIAIHGCVLAPITVLAITLGTNHIAYWGVAIGAMAIALVVKPRCNAHKDHDPGFLFQHLAGYSAHRSQPGLLLKLGVPKSQGRRSFDCHQPLKLATVLPI